MINIKDTFSFDESKIQIDIEKKRVIKKTNIIEYQNLVKLNNYLKNSMLNVPKVFSYNKKDQTISMEYIEGFNLELLLRNPKTYRQAAHILNNVFKIFLQEKLNWIEFAPRNIIITKDNQIYLIDFEKALEFNKEDNIIYLRNHVYEEYSSFLLPEDRIISSDKVFNLRPNEENYLIYVPDIKIKRIKYLVLSDSKDIISYEEYLNYYKLIINAETPYIQGDKIIFPRMSLSKFLKDKEIDEEVYYLYAYKIKHINNNHELIKNLPKWE